MFSHHSLLVETRHFQSLSMIIPEARRQSLSGHRTPPGASIKVAQRLQ